MGSSCSTPNDGGWSRGIPTKGSGWRKSKAIVAMDGASSVSSSSSSSSSTFVGGDKWSAMVEQRGSSKTRWLSGSENATGSGGQCTLVTTSDLADTWGSESPVQGLPSWRQSMWGPSEGNDKSGDSLDGLSSGSLPSLQSEVKESREKVIHSKENLSSPVPPWGDAASKTPRLVAGTNWKTENNNEKKTTKLVGTNLNAESSAGLPPRNVVGSNWKKESSMIVSVKNDGSTDPSLDTNSQQFEKEDILPLTANSDASNAPSKQEVGGVGWEELKKLSISNSEAAALGGNNGHNQESLGSFVSPPEGFPYHHQQPNPSIGSGLSANEGQISGSSNFISKVHNIHMNSSNSHNSEVSGGSRDISPHNDIDTPTAQGKQGGDATPNPNPVGEIKKDGAGDALGGSCWRAGRTILGGKTTCVGSVPSWKGDGERGVGIPQNRSVSPRKINRWAYLMNESQCSSLYVDQILQLEFTFITHRLLF